jgi:hypothetical protein
MRDTDRTRIVVVVVSIVLAVAGSAIGSGAFGGTPIQDAGGGALAADATLLAPGVGAFRIWSVIYLGLAAYAVLQALPAQRSRPRQRRIGWLAAASMLLNAAWILSIQLGLLALSVPVIVALLAVLVAILLRLGTAESLADRVLLDGVFGLYLGWVTIATVANTTALLQQAGFDGLGIAPAAWAVVVLVVAAAIGVATALRGGGRFAPAVALAWGVAWIAIARATGEPSSVPVAIAAGAVAVIVLVAPLLVRLLGRGAAASVARPAATVRP